MPFPLTFLIDFQGLVYKLRLGVGNRYLIMLIKGGMYTDSDTAPLSDPNLWGTHPHILTPPSLTVLQKAMQQLDPSDPHRSPSDHESKLTINPTPDSARGINNRHVSLVISVEYDIDHPRQDPRSAYTRDLQIVQWTFMVSWSPRRGEVRRD